MKKQQKYGNRQLQFYGGGGVMWYTNAELCKTEKWKENEYGFQWLLSIKIKEIWYGLVVTL